MLPSSSPRLRWIALAGLASALVGCPGPRFLPLDAGTEDSGAPVSEDAGTTPDSGTSRPEDGGICADDSREEDDSVMQAKNGSPLYSAVPIQLPSPIACPGDEDFVYAYGGSMKEAGALVTWDSAVGELLVDLLDGSGTPYLLNGTKDVQERAPGRVKLIHGEQSGFFIVRIRSTGGARVPYAAEIYAPAP